jgi:hypothetical protein
LNRLTIGYTIKNQEFYKAAATFRVAFMDEISAFRSSLFIDYYIETRLDESIKLALDKIGKMNEFAKLNDSCVTGGAREVSHGGNKYVTWMG